MGKKHRWTLFLDRDGVINHDSPGYIKNWAEVEFISGSLEALARLAAAGMDCIIITNQSAVGRGMITLETLQTIHLNMKKSIAAAGGNILDIFFCPHRPDGNCNCRKPKPGLILEAAKKHEIALNRSIMIGDSARDIECARAAGCGLAILVKTGNGGKALGQLEGKGLLPDFTADDFYAAANWIIGRYGV